ncbi:TetR family transcriptional regulator [Nonlabens spongiae]|uniref:TetR family transcriptional regulator n=1 Tax=Nonlabens spongiae TaxID=331648 RepID=A0A1W6MKF6_9FLAO|nr:TetR/AcrR family transcriptional regulator [Nonlabens spongiae]ARN78080.1 TetR family transcriptional regulator [Nonlabens spongiae]
MTQRKKAILNAAAKLFKERGYSAITMRDLAEELDIKASSLYNHISGKHEILSSLVLKVAQSFSSGMNEISAGGDSAFAKAEQLIQLHINIALSYPAELAVLNNDWMHLEGKDYEAYQRMRQDYERDFKIILEDGITNEEFKSFHVDTMLFNLLSTLRSIYLWIPKRSASEIADLQIELPKMLLNGLANQSLTASSSSTG